LCPFFLLSAEIRFQEVNTEIQQYILKKRGLFQLREQPVFQKFERTGIADSNQYLEGLFKISSHTGTDEKKSLTPYAEDQVKTKGFLMGTVSSSLKHPALRLGVGYGYFKSHANFEEHATRTKTRSHGLQLYVSYVPDVWQIAGFLGYVWTRNKLDVSGGEFIFHDNYFYGGSELGRYFAIGNQFLILYPHMGIQFGKYHTSAWGECSAYHDSIPSGELGMSFYKFLTSKLFLNGDFSWRHEFRDRKKISYRGMDFSPRKIGDHAKTLRVALGYFMQPDFSVYLTYDGFFWKKRTHQAVGIGISHNF
jgi:hypothetical protein